MPATTQAQTTALVPTAAPPFLSFSPFLSIISSQICQPKLAQEMAFHKEFFGFSHAPHHVTKRKGYANETHT
jgi:hypothetical protein